MPAPAPIWTYAQADAIYFAPRGADLDGDGRLEIIVTGGGEMPAGGEVVALDGATGAVRWRATAETELYSSPVFLDVTGDGVQDVFVGGRLQSFMAVDGASGDVLWRFEDTRPVPEYYFYNFYTPVLIADQTGDGVPDLLVANGGGDGIRPREARPPGHLAVLNAVDGTMVAVAVMPDHQETYMSPILLPDDGAASPTILFGTGGESWTGSLWEISLSSVLAGDLSDARALVTGMGKGVIAPPALADLDRDGRLDIIVATFDGRLIALSGTTREIIWQHGFENTESYTTPVLGFFDGDDVPDVFAVFLHGVFPDYTSAERVLLSGRDGSVLWQGTAGDFAMAGDVAVDLNGDGTDEVIFNANTINDPAVAPPRSSSCISSTAPAGRRDPGACRWAPPPPDRRGWATSMPTAAWTWWCPGTPPTKEATTASCPGSGWRRPRPPASAGAATSGRGSTRSCRIPRLKSATFGEKPGPFSLTLPAARARGLDAENRLRPTATAFSGTFGLWNRRFVESC